MIAFTIPGAPVGKGRPKFARRGSFVQTYTPEKTASYESLVKMAASQAMDGVMPIDGAVKCGIRIQVMPPASWSHKRAIAALGGEVMPTVKPDLDNVAKIILDSLNGIVYIDDKQVVSLLVEKVYAHRNCVSVIVEAA